MAPLLLDGDYVLISRCYRKVKAGHLVVIHHAFYHRIIKKVLAVSDDGRLWLGGENNQSLQPEQIGWVHPNRVNGKVVYCICKAR